MLKNFREKNKAPSDLGLNIVVISLLLFGILMVYSASSYSAQSHFGNSFHFVFKQMLGVFMGVICLIFFSHVDYHIFQKLRYLILAISIILLVVVFIPGVGVENYGAKRWINLPFFTLQASEIAKFGFVIFCAGYMTKYQDKMDKFVYLLPILAVGGVICVLIMLEPNMSITMCVVITMFVMLFVGGAKLKHFVAICVPVAILAPILIIIEPYRLNRLTAFLNPWETPLAEGFQLIQSYYALASGGLWGLGLFNSRQKYLFLPFSESDFIFSIIGEELGLVGCLVVMVAFCYMITKIIKIAGSSSDHFGAYLSAGIATVIATQVLLNIAVVTGSIPPTGLTLPFISAGSSSLIVFCSGIGITQSVKKYGIKNN